MLKVKKTKEQFINEAKSIHGEKYDYSKVEYVNNSTKVRIICPIHGEFYQTPKSHLHGNGCPRCGIIKRSNSKSYTTKSFIKKAIEVHGNKYDYSKVIYIDTNTKVSIICPKHGEFWQTPNVHLQGHGCPKCGKDSSSTLSRKNVDEFINEARKIHGDKYDYSKVEYINNKSKVCIICPKHGEFWMTPNSHISSKQGCPKCAKRNYVYTTDEWVKLAKNVHGNKYDYSKVEYIDSNTKVCIICPIHGEFWQLPTNHIKLRQGCPTCSNEKKKERRYYTTKEFIEKAREIHGDKYDYSKTIYDGIKKNVIITCPIHGDFLQKAHVHLNGCGCPMCNQSHLENEIEDLLKENTITYEKQKTFSWLKYKHNQYLDFYLPKYTIGIECQGKQHFTPIAFFTKNKEFIEKRFKYWLSNS